MPRPNAEHLLAALLAGLAVLPAQAELTDRTQKIHIDAGGGSRDAKNGFSILEGGVKLTQGTLSLKAESATLKELPSGDQQIKAQGNQVEFRQKLEGDRGWLDGKANQLEYDSQSGDVRLLGQAWLKISGDEISANNISYNTQTERYKAEGSPAQKGGNGRLRMVIQPQVSPAEAKTVEGQKKP
ncbi:lipopolysaccharide transport periplasmic protein LptA [Chitinimonas sp. BJB300]|uniref:lipopolysaccharide transport periplasmic protein LptA n=1 Tax=Chitinimonas sp. BJB300 TaxID=1559339 RepID=UPI000C0FC833|nr:lipopolysaccharide transport periplasmic protein LptA [Chitinimonas sp. BJB300]PHV10657.1 lipopolysaccharide transport periplasmic protein LptA [Chitinimonas sp. BJB300]TSJ90879.1 lipopolysaccharide transport periplasmic protein LptA [Chitinimonas sp. BJB300]